MTIITDILTDCYTGEDKTLQYTIYTDDTKTGIKDITGYTFAWELRKFRDSPTFVIQKTGAIQGAPSLGRVDVVVASSDWLAFTPGYYYHELTRTNAGARTVESAGRLYLDRGPRT